MICLLDRFFIKDLTVPEGTPAMDFFPHPRIQIQLFSDFITYEAAYFVDGKLALREYLINDPNKFYHSTIDNGNLHGFVLDYADALFSDV